jgi:mannose-6-phosphate isomerase
MTDSSPALPAAALSLRPAYQRAIWGGNTLALRYGRRDAPDSCAESWEISDRAEGPAVVLAGPLAGRTLGDLCRRFGRDLLGSRSPWPDRFPLLVKLIDARDLLSVQVHPGAHSGPDVRGEPKTEMWCLLRAEAGACLFAGLHAGTTPGALRGALAAGRVEDLLMRHPVAEGDALFIPGGLVHAIGAGCLIYEVQQNSNTTYRLYDWGRRLPDGRPRALHVEEALAAIDWSLSPPRVQRAAPAPGEPAACAVREVTSCPWFRVRRIDLTEGVDLDPAGATFHALFVISGRVRVTTPAGEADFAAGRSALIPACVARYRIDARDDPVALLLTTLA